MAVCFLISGSLVEQGEVSEVFSNLSWYTGVMVGAYLLHGFVVLPILFFLLTRTLPFQFIRNISQAIFTAFGTASRWILWKKYLNPSTLYIFVLLYQLCHASNYAQMFGGKPQDGYQAYPLSHPDWSDGQHGRRGNWGSSPRHLYSTIMWTIPQFWRIGFHYVIN